MSSPPLDDIHIESSDTGVSIVWQSKRIRFEHSFIDGELVRRARQSNQAVLKACSNRRGTIHSVLDLTAGWGLDGFILATHGKRVTLLEKNALVADVIETSLKKLGEFNPVSRVFNNITLVQGNALEYLQQPEMQAVDCIYLDPMFPAHKSGAKPSKSLQLLQQLTVNEDIESCFELARLKAANRVVVKRPLKAPWLTNCVPSEVVKEKTIRFDIYLSADKK